jgi:hypothetical protein
MWSPTARTEEQIAREFRNKGLAVEQTANRRCPTRSGKASPWWYQRRI